MHASTKMTSTRVDPAEYLALERKAERRSEYVDGTIRPIPPSNIDHNQIVMNLIGSMHPQLRGGRCEMYIINMRVKVRRTGAYLYPDAVVVCDGPELEDRHADTLLNPTLVIEVLSDLTERYDRGEKFAHYRRLQSLREYVLVAQDSVRIERFMRDGDDWLIREVSDLNETVELPSLGCSLRLADVYERVEFGGAGEV